MNSERKFTTGDIIILQNGKQGTVVQCLDVHVNVWTGYKTTQVKVSSVRLATDAEIAAEDARLYSLQDDTFPCDHCGTVYCTCEQDSNDY